MHRTRQDWYNRGPHPQAHERKLESLKKISQTRRAWMDELKNNPCVDCGAMFPPVCMDWDHVRGIKLFTIGTAFRRNRTLILQEIEKCDLVCSNCHRIRTKNRGYHHD